MRFVFLLLLWVGCAHASRRQPPQTRPSGAQLYAVARLAEQQGDRLRAQQYYAAALRSGHAASEVLPRFLRLCILDGQYRLAIAHANEALADRGQDPLLRLLLAELYDAAALDLAAEREYERVIAAQPENAQAHLELAWLLARTNRAPGRADEHLRAYLTLEPDGPYADKARAQLLKEVP